jgi:hypothetical protein
VVGSCLCFIEACLTLSWYTMAGSCLPVFLNDDITRCIASRRCGEQVIGWWPVFINLRSRGYMDYFLLNRAHITCPSFLYVDVPK